MWEAGCWCDKLVFMREASCRCAHISYVYTHLHRGFMQQSSCWCDNLVVNATNWQLMWQAGCWCDKFAVDMTSWLLVWQAWCKCVHTDKLIVDVTSWLCMWQTGCKLVHTCICKLAVGVSTLGIELLNVSALKAVSKCKWIFVSFSVSGGAVVKS